MHKAIPAIALSAAGLTWLLHAQGAIDSTASRSTGGQPAAGAAPTAGAPPTSVTPPPTTARRRGGDDDDEALPLPPRSTTTAPAPTTTSARSGNGERTADGPTVENRYGPVQVEVVVSGGKITDVKALQYPSDARRSQAINDQALPLLKEEVLQAQSSNIDGVSGATYTSEGYQRSLQAALDQVGMR